MVLDVILLLLWTAIDPSAPATTYEDVSFAEIDSGSEFVVVGTICETGIAGILFEALLLLYKAALIGGGSYMAYIARNFSDAL